VGVAGAGAGAGGFAGAQDELVKAWGYAFAMENLVAWMVEVFQVRGKPPILVSRSARPRHPVGSPVLCCPCTLCVWTLNPKSDAR
jgi:hypothetical protein